MEHAELNSTPDEQIAYKARGFCAVLTKREAKSMRSDNPEDFFPLIE